MSESNLFIISALLGILVFMGVVVYSAHEEVKERPMLFEIWVKENPRSNLTFDEWNLLRKRDLLRCGNET